MKEITKNEINFILALFRNPDLELNSRNIAKMIGVTHMGAFKISNKLEKEELIKLRRIGKAIICSLNWDNDYVGSYVKFLLQRESKDSSPLTKVWIKEFKRLKSAKAVVLFGSVLTKGREANDIDALIIIDEKHLNKVEKEIEDINKLMPKRIHPVFQTEKDLKNNIIKQDKVILNAIKGVLVFGEDVLVRAIEK
jgi:predicted nucleotidyltransferase